MLDNARLVSLRLAARTVRRDIVTMVHKAKSGHIGGSLSAADLVVALYYEVIQVDPENPRWTASCCRKATVLPCSMPCSRDAAFFRPKTWQLSADPGRISRGIRII